MTVSGSYFQVLGARPMLGRTLLPEDDEMVAGGRWANRAARPVAARDHVVGSVCARDPAAGGW
jgi:hypothetical protein